MRAELADAGRLKMETLSNAAEAVRPWLDSWVVFAGGVVGTAAFGFWALQKAIEGLKSFWHLFTRAAALVEVQTGMMEQFEANGKVLAEIAAQFNNNGGSSLRDTIEANHREAEVHWTAAEASSSTQGTIIGELSQHILNLDEQQRERGRIDEELREDIKRVEKRVDRFVELLLDQEGMSK